MAEENFVTVNTYSAALTKIISVPAHYSINEILETVRSEMAGHTVQGQVSEPLNHNPLSVTVAGEFQALISLTLLDYEHLRLRSQRWHARWSTCTGRLNQCNHLRNAKFGRSSCCRGTGFTLFSPTRDWARRCSERGLRWIFFTKSHSWNLWKH